MPALKPSLEVQLEVSMQIARLRELCDQLDAAVADAARERHQIRDLTSYARAVLGRIERLATIDSPES
jgi:hypothetical protein